MEVVNKLE